MIQVSSGDQDRRFTDIFGKAARASQLPPAPTEAQQIEQFDALCFVLNAHVADLEASNAELRAALNLDAPPPTLSAGWLTVKQVAYIAGLTQSGVRAWIRKRRVEGKKLGGRVFINSRTIPARPRISRRMSASIQ